jgi:hypothetical protein
MGYASEKEQKLSILLREVIYKAQDITQNESIFLENKQFSDELFYARITGKFLGILGHINSELRKGKKIEDINLDK